MPTCFFPLSLHPIFTTNPFGKVLEWLKRHAWKACNRQNWFAGSNPVLSAHTQSVSNDRLRFFFRRGQEGMTAAVGEKSPAVEETYHAVEETSHGGLFLRLAAPSKIDAT